jgi:hypothetical protein
MTTTLSSSLVAALGELENVTKNARNPHFKSSYASLDAILDAVRPVLKKHGLAISQEPLSEEGKAGVVTKIIHTSGEFTSSTLLLPVQQNTCQAYGSALSYARRYSIASICGIFQDDGTEDDGHLASSPPGRSTAAQPFPRVETKERKGAEAAGSTAGLKPTINPKDDVNLGPDIADNDLPF